MGELHRFVRLQLWRLTAVVAALFTLALLLGVHGVVLLLEWTPMAACVLIALAEVGKALGRGQRHRR